MNFMDLCHNMIIIFRRAYIVFCAVAVLSCLMWPNLFWLQLIIIAAMACLVGLFSSKVADIRLRTHNQ